MPEKMNHYQKLAVIMLRCIGLGLACFGLLAATWRSYLTPPGTVFESLFMVAVLFMLHTIPGMILFVGGGFLGRLIGRGYAERPQIFDSRQDRI